MLSVKKHFIFGKKYNLRKGKLLFRLTHSNIFLIFLDLKSKVIQVVTSGSANVSHSKKQKRSPQAIEQLVLFIMPFFEVYKVKLFDLIVVGRVKTHLFSLLKELGYRDLLIDRIIDKKKVAHNGVRKRNLRRV